MGLKRRYLLLDCLLVCLAGCSSNNPAPPTKGVSNTTATPVVQASVTPSPVAEQATGGIDACSLVTTAETAEVQGSAIKEAKSSRRGDGDFLMSQCFYTAEDFVRSVSLSVVQSNPAKPAKQPREYFTEKFRGAGNEAGGEREREREKERDKAKAEKREEGESRERGAEEEEEEGANVEPIGGLGDGAYWVKTGPTASLYVLKNNQFLILSIGGGDPEPVRLRKTKALAQKALNRMK